MAVRTRPPVDNTAAWALLYTSVSLLLLIAALGGNSYSDVSFKYTAAGSQNWIAFNFEFSLRTVKWNYQGTTGDVIRYGDAYCNFGGCNAIYFIVRGVVATGAVGALFYFFAALAIKFYLWRDDGYRRPLWKQITIGLLIVAWLCNFASWVIWISGGNTAAGQMASAYPGLKDIFLSTVMPSVSARSNVPILADPTSANYAADTKPYASFWGDLLANIVAFAAIFQVLRIRLGHKVPDLPLEPLPAQYV